MKEGKRENDNETKNINASLELWVGRGKGGEIDFKGLEGNFLELQKYPVP